MTLKRVDSIPRLDKVGYLYETLGWINDGATFEELRQAQVAYRKDLDRENFVDKRSGVSSGRQLQKRTEPQTYWTNVRASVTELIRLGLVEPAPVPSRKEQLEANGERSYTVTPEGARFLSLMEQDPQAFQDHFAQAFLFAHPSVRQLLIQLAYREFFIPRLGTDELRQHIRRGTDSPSSLLPLVEEVCGRVSDAGGPDIAPERLMAEFEPGMTKFWTRCDPTLKHHDFNKAVVKAFNDQLLRAMAVLHRVPLSVIDLRVAASLLAGFRAVDSSHALLDRTGWTIWSTCEIPSSDHRNEGRSPAAAALAGPAGFYRRVIAESTLRDKIIESVQSIPSREGGFALIHEVRACVCHEHQIHSSLFNQVLRKMHRGEITHPAYRLYLDRGGYSHLPPSEMPFSTGGRDFYLIAFFPSEERHHGPRQQVYS